jgi:hypothetical protein
MNRGTGALPPPGMYAAHEAVAKKMATTSPGYVNYILVAGFNGMAMRVNFDTIHNSMAAWKEHYGTLRTIPNSKDTLQFALIDGVEVFFGWTG